MCKTNLNGEDKEDRARLLVVPSGGTGGKRHKLKYRRFPLNIWKQFFIVRVTEYLFPREVVESPAEEIFKALLDTVLGSLVYLLLVELGLWTR